MFKLSILLLLILVVSKETVAVRGALFRSGRAVPFERVPGQQKLAPKCREVELYVPCLFTYNRTCVIDKICVHELPVVTTPRPTTPVTTPNTKRENSVEPRRNVRHSAILTIAFASFQDFLRFGRAVMASGVGGGSEGNAPDDMKSFVRINGEPEILFQ
uniref:Secreted protein n=1 Tax=Caenorhabditis tropicalis TaxID=1561998 RepID=A0A1I7URA1_9PELO